VGLKLRGGSALRLVSARAWLQRFTFALLFAGAFALMIIGKSDSDLVLRARLALSDALTPILDAVSRPLESARQAFENARDYVNLRTENEALRQDQARLEQWEIVARQLQAENDGLRSLLKFVPDPNASFVTARVVADNGGAFVRTALVAAGFRDGVRRGDAAMTGDGLVGRVVEVGDRSARILLLTDINSRIPVIVERTRDQAILAGDNSDNPRLLYLPHGISLAVGDRIVTSTAGGAFPPGLPIGQVMEVDDSMAIVGLFVDWDRLEYLRLVDYHLPGILQGNR